MQGECVSAPQYTNGAVMGQYLGHWCTGNTSRYVVVDTNVNEYAVFDVPANHFFPIRCIKD